MTIRAQNWINGAARGAERWVESANPATTEVLGVFADARLEDGQEAISAARSAFDSTDWKRQPRMRERVLLAIADRIDANHDTLVELLVAENGKTRALAAGEVATCSSEFRFYAGLSRTIFGRVTAVEPDSTLLLKREPIGVAGIIVPWNAPLILLVRSLAPALAAGCTTVIKAAPQTALTSAEFMRVVASVAEVPDGVINMVAETGNAIAKLLVDSADVDVISYTGSTHVGKMIMEAGAKTLKRMNLELGGSAPAVVFPDADLDMATEVMVKTSMVMAGQMCVALSRVIAHEEVIEELSARLASRLSTMVVGNGADSRTEMGPMIDHAACQRIANLLNDADASGEVILKGEKPGGDLAQGAFMTPSLVRVRSQTVPLLQGEIFGPLLTIDSFRDEAEGIFKANQTSYGLAASVWTRDFARAQRMADRIDAGTVWINQHLRLYPEAETGGYKQSGIGRLHGVEGLAEFMHTKCIGWDYGPAAG